MKVSKNDVIARNLSLIQGFISDIRTGDPIDLVVDRVGDRVTVSPDDQQAEEITVVFKINGAMSVSKGAELDNIASLINAVTQGNISALGTGLRQGAMVPGNGIGGATLDTLTKIMTTVADQGNVNVYVEMNEINISNPPVRVSTTGSVTGWTVTTDTDSDEQAIVSHQAKLLAQSGRIVKTNNTGTSSQMRIDSTNSVAIAELSTATALGVVNLAWSLKTDGAFTHDTVSLIQIDTITVVLKYE